MIWFCKDEKQMLLKTIKKIYGFLVKQYCYEYTLEEYDGYSGVKYYIIQYTNKQFKRQVELVLHRNSSPISFYIKRLVNDQVPEYKDTENCYNFFEIDFFTNPNTYLSERHSPYNPPDYEYGTLKTGVEILKSNLDLIKGINWIDREKLDKLSIDIKGYKMGWHETPIVGTIKEIFRFLIDEHGFDITDDYDKLRPFEQGLGGEIVYYNKNRKIGFEFSFDLRDEYLSLYSFYTSKDDKQLLEALYLNKEDLLKARNIVNIELTRHIT
ncbi:hypothetical protein [Phosphitispora sp. TUW77]|uniref:hypothetical protein n=1 Tax=Phosphitispora sp. TUW77 TaxID=3152361 RepID=UPI003AB1F380